jgi:hypothetical protein
MDQSISQPVGDGAKAKNLYDDVVTIQKLLNQITPPDGGPNPPLKVDGICGHKTKSAIQNFQLLHFGWKLADGRVDPGGPTLARMNELAAAPEFQSMGFRMRRLEDDSTMVPASKPQLFHVQYLEAALRNALYSFALQPVSANPSAYPASAFRGGWNGFTTRAPTTIRGLGCKARQSTFPVPDTPWGPPGDYYKVNPGHTMEMYLASGTLYVPVGFETQFEVWGDFTYAGEIA